jgi:hypothetical protein
MPHEANIGCKTDSRQEMLGARWTVWSGNDISILQMISTASLNIKNSTLAPMTEKRSMHAASFILVVLIHALSVISPASLGDRPKKTIGSHSYKVKAQLKPLKP